jgi:hypothetical protein
MEKETENLVETYLQKEINEINNIKFRNDMLKMFKKYISMVNNVQDKKRLLLNYGSHALDDILTNKGIQGELYRDIMEDILEFTQDKRPTHNQWHLHDHETFTLRNEIRQMVGLSGLEQRAAEPIQPMPEQIHEPPRQRTLVQRARRTMRHALRLLVCGSPSQQEHRGQHQRMQ